MYGTAALLILALASAHPIDAGYAPAKSAGIGEAAMRHTRAAVAFGPRTPGSPAMRKFQAYILEQLRPLGGEITEDAFTADTPAGRLPMKNIIVRFRGVPGREAVAITGHYDTKIMPGRFDGANDGAASAGLLLALAREVAYRKRANDVYLVWFDGEEAVAQWSETDGLYGSRHLARRWDGDGTLRRLKALINVDMIGDRDLDITRDGNSSGPLQDLVWRVAREMGYGRHFLDAELYMDDDHVPFASRGVNVLDLIDFNYGPGNSWWHSPEDTLDKLSAASLDVVGKVLLTVLYRLE